MSQQLRYTLIVLILLFAAGLRMWQLPTLPLGMHDGEITNIRLADTIREGNIRVFYELENGEGREGLYNTVLALVDLLAGSGLLSYRILSVWTGMITLALTYAMGLRLFGWRTALLATALLAVMMWHNLLSRQVMSESLLTLAVAALMLALARALAVYREVDGATSNTTAFAAVGVILGGGLYLHPSGLIIALAAMLFIGFMLIAQRNETRHRLTYIGFAVLVMIIIAVPYLISTVNRPELAAAGRIIGGYDGILSAISNGLSGISFQGDANPAFNLPGRPLIDLASGLFVVTGLLITLRSWRNPPFTLLLVMVMIPLPAVLLAPGSPNFLYFAPILLPLVLLFSLGVNGLVNSAPRQTRRIIITGVILLIAFNGAWTINSLFQQWPQRDDVKTAYQSDLGQLAHYLDQTSGTLPSVLCFPGWKEADEANEPSRTRLMLRMMNRSLESLRFTDCRTSLVFTGGGGREQIILPEPRLIETFDSHIRNWLALAEVPVNPNVPQQTVFIMDVAEEVATVAGRFTTTAPISYPPEVIDAERPLVNPPVRFGGNITFLGYERSDPPDTEYTAGDTLSVITYWRVEGELPPDLNLFIHLLSDPFTIAAQRDVIGANPRQLTERDVFVQTTTIQLPPELPSGEYLVSTGAYQDSSDTRLPVFEDEQIRGDRLFLYPVMVNSSAEPVNPSETAP